MERRRGVYSSCLPLTRLATPTLRSACLARPRRRRRRRSSLPARSLRSSPALPGPPSPPCPACPPLDTARRWSHFWALGRSRRCDDDDARRLLFLRRLQSIDLSAGHQTRRAASGAASLSHTTLPLHLIFIHVFTSATQSRAEQSPFVLATPYGHVRISLSLRHQRLPEGQDAI